MNVDLRYLQNWLIANRLTLNLLKTECMLLGSKQQQERQQSLLCP